MNEYHVEYMLVGGYAVVYHGYLRTTGDMDIWVNCTKENYNRLVAAFTHFGMPIFDMTLSNFLDTDQFDVFTFGVPPVAIDVMTKVKGLDFDTASKSLLVEKVNNDLSIKVIPFEYLIEAKKASGRSKDINDIEQLTNSDE